MNWRVFLLLRSALRGDRCSWSLFSCTYFMWMRWVRYAWGLVIALPLTIIGGLTLIGGASR